MNWLAQLDWRAPAWGLLALQPLLLDGLASWRRQQQRAYADAALRPWAIEPPAASGRSIAWRLLHLLAWALLAAALAGPRLPWPVDVGAGTPDQPLHRLTIYAVLELSPVMQGKDVAPDRLSRARLKLLDLIDRLHGERLGLIVYSASAGLLSPPSDDPGVLRGAVNLAQPDLMQQPGDDPAAALTLALNQARQQKEPSAVLLMSAASAQSLQGASGDAVRAAVAGLARAHVPLFVLGVGTLTGAVLRTADGGAAVSRPDAPDYQALASSTGGRYVQITDSNGDLRALYDHGLARLPAPPLPRHAAHAWRELYPWLLAPGLALMLLLYLPAGRGRHAAVLFAAGLILPLPRAHADTSALAASQAWRGAHYAEAQIRYAQLGGYAGQLGAGAAAWQLGNYGDAARYFSNALMLAATPGQCLDALYDLGSALYGLGHWQAAVEAFQAVLRERPHDARALANLRASLWRLKQHAPHPLPQTDLRARPGLAVAGEMDLDWDSAAVQHLKPTPLGPLVHRGAIPGAGAELQGKEAAAMSGTMELPGWQSGFKKLQLLRDRRRTLARGLLSQDAATSGAPGPIP